MLFYSSETRSGCYHIGLYGFCVDLGMMELPDKEAAL